MCFGGICVAGSDVAGASFHNFIRDGMTAGFFEGVYNLQNAGAVAGAQVDCLHAGVRKAVINGFEVSQSKVYDMDGDGTGDVCFVRESPSVSEPGVTYRVLGNDYTLTDGDSGYIECYISKNRKWDDKKYVRPIPTTALNDNPALGQNPGWKTK